MEQVISMITVKTNISALNTYRNLKNTGLSTRKSVTRLASGYRINSAADDAAGLAISETMRAQIRGLDQAHRNTNDGIALIKTGEGGMAEINDMVIRKRELVVQAANDTNTVTNREQIKYEINQLKNEINSIADRVEFNTRILLNGDHSLNAVSGLSISIMPLSSHADDLAQMVRDAYAALSTGQRNALIGMTAGATAGNIRTWVTSVLPSGYRFSTGPTYDGWMFNANALLGPSFSNSVSGLNYWFENVFFWRAGA